MRRTVSLKASKSLIEVEPFGLAPSSEASRPLMLFKEVDGEMVLPVWVSQLDAGIALIQNHSNSKSPSPHEFLKELLETLEIELTSCTFEEVIGHHQFVNLKLRGSRKVKELKTRADHVVSLCMHTGCRFFTTLEVLKKSQDVEAEMNDMAHKIQAAPQLAKNPYPYLN